jgi:hypothetical protein
MLTTTLLIIHGLMATALLGAVTHQACAVAAGARSRGFWGRFRGVQAQAYTPAICVMVAITAVLGALIYPQYRIDVRPTLEDLNMRAANGVFEIKEHLVAIALGILPGYWVAWHSASQDYAPVRKYLTWLIAGIVWFGFIVGHILNNIKGLVP